MDPASEITNNRKKKFISLILFSIIVIAGLTGIFVYMAYKKTHITTDDAFVTGRVHIIASKVPGTVKALYISDNQFVKENDLLMVVDDRDYAVMLNQAESALNAERAKLAELSTSIDVAEKRLLELRFRIESAKANLKLQEANFKQAKVDLTRGQRLLKKEIMPEEQFEKIKTSYDVASARLKAAKDQLRQSEASLETQRAIIKQTESAFQSQGSRVKQKEAIRKGEDLKISYTRIYSPSDGYITKKSVETGNQIQAGQSLMAVVYLDDVWITANYKETQLEKVKPGQKVRIKVDTYPDKVFKGTVESIMAGTGSVFSLFPPENATGNFVKVVQRIPVKIVLAEETNTNHIFRIGMSVEPTIIIEK